MSPARKRSSDDRTTCPWCSSAVPATAVTCASCGASLRDAAEGDILGVTQVDPAAHVRAGRTKGGRRFAAWLAGERPQEGDESGLKVEPASEAVRREMLRLELAAIDAEIEARKSQVEAQRELPPESAEGSPG
jgi:hypothetical protein